MRFSIIDSHGRARTVGVRRLRATCIGAAVGSVRARRIVPGPSGPVPAEQCQYYERLTNTGELGFTAARYLTRHLKIEGEARFTGEGRRYAHPLHAGAGFPQPDAGQRRAAHQHARRFSGRDVAVPGERVGAPVSCMAGAAFEFERNRVDIWQQSLRRAIRITVQYRARHRWRRREGVLHAARLLSRRHARRRWRSRIARRLSRGFGVDF